MALVMLKKRRDFVAMRFGCRRARRDTVLLLVRSGQTLATRVGITITKKVGNAVVRNRVRRRMREILRGEWTRLLPGHDYVFIVHEEAAKASFEHLRNDILSGLRCAAPSRTHALV